MKEVVLLPLVEARCLVGVSGLITENGNEVELNIYLTSDLVVSN